SYLPNTQLLAMMMCAFIWVSIQIMSRRKTKTIWRSFSTVPVQATQSMPSTRCPWLTEKAEIDNREVGVSGLNWVATMRLYIDFFHCFSDYQFKFTNSTGFGSPKLVPRSVLLDPANGLLPDDQLMIRSEVSLHLLEWPLFCFVLSRPPFALSKMTVRP